MNQPWTPRELIAALEKWEPDQPIELVLTNNDHPFKIDVSLAQNNNFILLTPGRGQ